MSTRTSILLIEDNPGDANLIDIYLQESSFKVDLKKADTLFEGLDIIKNNPPVDIVLLDLSLPDSSGFKTLSSFIEKAPNIPVIVLTGLNNEIVGNQAIKAGAQDFLVKGHIDSKLLAKAIRYAIQRFTTKLKLTHAAKDLALSEKRYLEAQEMAHFGNWEVDIVSNEMHWTDEVYRILGIAPGSFNPSLSDYLSHVYTEDRPAVEAFFEAAAKDGQLHKLEHRIVREGRAFKHVAIQAKINYEEISEKILLVGVIQDITERKLNEQLIIEKNITSKASKVKEAALADISFHIRTPLSSVVNLLYLLENTSVSGHQRELIEGLKTSADDLSIMVNNLLNFSLMVSDKIKIEEENIELDLFAQSIKKVLQLKADTANIKLNLDISKTHPTVISDTNKLNQIIYNLLDNAIHISPESSEVNMVVNVDTDSRQPKLKLVVHNDGLQLDAQEIQEFENADKLLEQYDIDQEEDNRPLGMAITTKLIKVMNGQLNIASSEGKTTFTITLPVDVPATHKTANGENLDGPLKILLVEDHFLNQLATKKVLTAWSNLVSVDIAENGLIGVEKFREHGYDVILMDIQMPVMNGIEAAQRIRESSQVPIIALTANSSKQEASKCLEIGMNDYMAKPFQPQELYSRIMNLLVAAKA